MMMGLGVHSPAQIEMPSDTAMGPIDSPAVRQDMGQGALGAELTIALARLSASRSAKLGIVTSSKAPYL